MDFISGPGDAFVAITAIVAGCIIVAAFFRYGSQIVRAVFGPPAVGAKGDDASLTQGEIEGMIRRAVREEMQPLREKIERIEQRGSEQRFEKAPHRDLPAGKFEEDPNDFGLIAEDRSARETTGAA